jgi:hypothetical protein
MSIDKSEEKRRDVQKNEYADVQNYNEFSAKLEDELEKKIKEKTKSCLTGFFMIRSI